MNEWGWQKTKEDSKAQRKMFIRLANLSWFVTLPALIISTPIGLFFVAATLCLYGSVLPNYLHEKIFLK